MDKNLEDVNQQVAEVVDQFKIIEERMAQLEATVSDNSNSNQVSPQVKKESDVSHKIMQDAPV